MLQYLKHDPPDYVLFTLGLHDTPLPITPEIYGSNLKWLFGLLTSVFDASQLFFMAATPVNKKLQPEKYHAVTPNDKNFAFNMQALQLSLDNGIAFIDVFPLLQLPYYQQFYNDGIHQKGQSAIFYKMWTSLILSVVCGHTRLP